MSRNPSPVPTADRDSHCDPEHGCVTCGDVAVPMRVIAVDDDRGLALCADEDGQRESVEIALVLPVSPADELLVHAGTAIAKTQADPVAADAGAEQAAG